MQNLQPMIGNAEGGDKEYTKNSDALYIVPQNIAPIFVSGKLWIFLLSNFRIIFSYILFL
jgi:hypothetical protein